MKRGGAFTALYVAMLLVTQQTAKQRNKNNKIIYALKLKHCKEWKAVIFQLPISAGTAGTPWQHSGLGTPTQHHLSPCALGSLHHEPTPALSPEGSLEAQICLHKPTVPPKPQVTIMSRTPGQQFGPSAFRANGVFQMLHERDNPWASNLTSYYTPWPPLYPS